VRSLATDYQPRALRPTGQLNVFGDLHDVAVLALAAVLVQGRNPGILWDLEDRLADGLGEVLAEREPHPALAAVVG